MRSLSEGFATAASQRTAIAFAWVVGAFLPLVWLSIQLHLPVMASTFASTVAVACAAPVRFREARRGIALAYLVAMGTSAAVAFPLEVFGSPDVAWASVAAGVIALSSAGRVHAPTACVPFALVGAPGLSGLTAQFAVLLGGLVWTMTVLLTLQPPSGERAPVEQ